VAKESFTATRFGAA